MPVTTRVTPEDAGPDEPHFVTLEHLLSPDECREWIELAEHVGFDEAPIQIGGGREARVPEIRNNQRVMIDGREQALALWQRTRPHLPTATLVQGRWRATGFNERLRFYRYEPGQRFALHADGHYRRPDRSETSRMSFLIYLNEDFEGGQTSLPGLGLVVPATGLALCFEHRYLHEGRPVISGCKYVLRTDLMYAAID
ncbi:prolyl hydroxylase family protein [Nannocystaceae bacterium ST9]